MGWAMAYALCAWRDPIFRLVEKFNTLTHHLIALGLAIASIILYALRDPDWDPVWEDRVECDISSQKAMSRGLQSCS